MPQEEQLESLNAFEAFIGERQQNLTEFLRENRENANALRLFLKTTFDLVQDVKSRAAGELRDTLLVNPEFDEEQIWQQVEMYNEVCTVSLLKRLKDLIAQTNESHSFESLWLEEPSESRTKKQTAVTTSETLESHSDESVSSESEQNSEDDLAVENDDEDEIDNALQRELDRVMDEQQEEPDDDEEDGEKGDEEEEEEGQTEEGDEEAEKAEQQQDEGEAEVDDENEEEGVDDTFFKLSEMEAFADGTDAAASDEDEKEQDASGDDEPVYYAQFFDPPRADGDRKMKERFLNERFGDKGDAGDSGKSTTKKLEKSMKEAQKHNESERTDKTDSKKRKNKDSAIETDSFADRIKQAEEERIGPKSWQMRGEVTARDRPVNALLGETLEFDYGATTRPDNDTERGSDERKDGSDPIERMIKERIRGRLFDDVVRKTRPTESKFELNKDVLDAQLQEKSKESLAAVYERDFLDRVNAQRLTAAGDDAAAGADAIEAIAGDEAVTKLRSEVRQLLTNVCLKLDALTNTHFNPRFYNKSDDVQVLAKSGENKQVAALVMEDVAPVATSDVQLLRPEEISARAHAKSQDELTSGEKKILRKRAKRRLAIASANGKLDKSDKREDGESDGQDKQKQKKKKRRANAAPQRSANKEQRAALRTSSRFFEALQKDVAEKSSDKKQRAKRENSAENTEKRTAKQLKM